MLVKLRTPRAFTSLKLPVTLTLKLFGNHNSCIVITNTSIWLVKWAILCKILVWPAFNNRTLPVPSGIEPLRPFHGVDIQPSEACLRNFVIFDKSNTRSQIIFHPEIRSKFFDFGLADRASILKDEDDTKDANANYEGNFFSLLKEDLDNIDALLSMDDVENEGYDDEEVSTARTDAIYECDSPDSCSNYESPPRKRSVFGTSSVMRFNYKKRERMRTTVKVLKRMVPGAKRMSTVTILDEAVRYLKSLKAQVHNLETWNSKTHARS